MREFGSNAEFLAALQALIELWCDRRNLSALSNVLPGYVAFNGMNDGWHELAAALRRARSLGRDRMAADEWDALDDLIHATDTLLRR